MKIFVILKIIKYFFCKNVILFLTVYCSIKTLTLTATFYVNNFVYMVMWRQKITNNSNKTQQFLTQRQILFKIDITICFVSRSKLNIYSNEKKAKTVQ